jgi:hypothetical protein
LQWKMPRLPLAARLIVRIGTMRCRQKGQTTSIGFASGSSMVRPLGPNAAVAITLFAARAMFCWDSNIADPQDYAAPAWRIELARHALGRNLRYFSTTTIGALATC